MPEGDTIYKVAQYVAPRLEGRELIGVTLLGSQVALLARRRVLSVRALGKHLLILLAPSGPGGYVLRVHLGMFGSWHSYPPGARYKAPAWEAHVVLVRDDGHQFVCFRPEDVELLQAQDAFKKGVLAALGPCLLSDPFVCDAVIKRAAQAPAHTPMIDILLNQAIAAGLGNVYKSELLFLHGLHPLTPKSALPLGLIGRIFDDGRTLLRRNLGGWPRTITYDRSREPDRPQVPRYFVYGRKELPCSRCASPIQRAVWGRHSRSCYYCLTCQPESGALAQPGYGSSPHASKVP